MRIFLCCQQSARSHGVPAYGFWAHYFREAFTEAHHTCIEAPGCDWAEGLLSLSHEERRAWTERTWTTAFDYVKREHARAPIDLFLSYLFPAQVEPSALAEVRALGIPSVNFFCDNVREFRRVPTEFRAFDLHWVPEHKAIPLYARAGLPWLHAPMACWVPPEHRRPVNEEKYPVTFVGTRDEQRERLFAEALRGGLRIDLRGTGWLRSGDAVVSSRAKNPLTIARRQLEFARKDGWNALGRKVGQCLNPPASAGFDFSPYAKPALSADEYWQVIRESTVLLGVNRYPSLRLPRDRPDSYSRLRDIEAPMAGACYLTEWTEALDQLYDLGREIEVYRDAGELAEKAQALARDAERRKALRERGQRRALAEHNIARTIVRIAERLGCAQRPAA